MFIIKYDGLARLIICKFKFKSMMDDFDFAKEEINFEFDHLNHFAASKANQKITWSKLLSFQNTLLTCLDGLIFARFEIYLCWSFIIFLSIKEKWQIFFYLFMFFSRWQPYYRTLCVWKKYYNGYQNTFEKTLLLGDTVWRLIKFFLRHLTRLKLLVFSSF